jgi:hypothetical protein
LSGGRQTKGAISFKIHLMTNEREPRAKGCVSRSEFYFSKRRVNEMAKNNHITSDHWKVGGQGHNGENLLHEVNKQKYAQAQKAQKDSAAPIPNQDEQQQHNETPAAKGGSERAGEATKSSNSSSGDY